MALVSPSTERMDLSRHMNPSPSGLVADVASEPSSSSDVPITADPPDPNDQSSSSPGLNRESLVSLRSEEYRQLFRLPTEEVSDFSWNWNAMVQAEVLVQDFNCAFQESILLQLVAIEYSVCFLSSYCKFQSCFEIIDEFMLQKIIPFHEITTVKRAKTAGIFPNAIEIFAGGRKYFFASFLSRDEAFKIIMDGWLQHGSGSPAISEQQDSSSETSSPQNGPVIIERDNSSKHPSDALVSIKRDEDILNDSELPPRVENDASTTILEVQDENVEQDGKMVTKAETSSSSRTLLWKLENSDAPKGLCGFMNAAAYDLPECYTKTAETKFPMKVEEVFKLLFSDDAVNFTESFHSRCGDKDFRCTSWHPHDEFGHTREISFQHPIKIYFGAKFGGCQEVQKFRVYRNSHLVIETTQEVSDVPYADYFRVEGRWDIERDGNESKEGCILRVYVNVAFLKKTVWKGKIVQSTLEECREAFQIWISMAHDLLKQKNLERQEEGDPAASTGQDVDLLSEREVKTVEPSEKLCDSNGQIRTLRTSDPLDPNQRIENHVQGSLISSSSVGSLLRESMTKFCSFLKSQNRVSIILVIAFAVIFLMQVSIVVLLNRPQHIHVASPPDYIGGMGGGVGERLAQSAVWIEKRMHYLKDEMLMVEARLERMWQEHAVLKAQLKDLEEFHKSH
ncbi:hypothetical protein JRO89_XS01G0014700 [Xanthoceras sorbifolium]|uniref:VASt domain-containing protein n=1 Tax=Xanthoceras sorbifolium TaxID=99658 RepID=A0ABQ8IHT5_9ROSI|nr:hypothetical protein JRO89_XS01G0014700 [Xanthoceras sorbifolium]